MAVACSSSIERVCDTTLPTPNSPRWIPPLRQPGYPTVGLVPLGGCEWVRGVGEEVVFENWGIFEGSLLGKSSRLRS